MTVGQDDAISAPTPDAGPKPSPFQRIIGVMFSPDATFASIAKRPDWVLPLVILCVVGLLCGIAIAQRVDFNTVARDAMDVNPQTAKMPPERVATMVHFTAGMMKVSAYASPVLTAIVLMIVGGVLLLAFRVFGGEGDFKQAFSVTTYAWYPRLAKGILAAIILLSKKGISIWDLQNPVRSNLGFLFDPKTQPVQFALGSSLDLFAIWSVFLLIVGFAAVSRVSKARSAVIVVSLWVVVNIFTLIGPLMQSLSANK
jgi:Yip1 domain.